MKIMQVHNRYLAGAGGEDTVIDQEYKLLTGTGNAVDQVTVTTSHDDVTSLSAKLKTAVSSVWSKSGYDLISAAISMNRPDVLHVHNTFPLLSPSIYKAAQDANVPVVHTLHNYRLICANGLLLRDNVVCEDCVGGSSMPAIKHRCYKQSLAATLPHVAIRHFNKNGKNYDQNVDRFIVLTEFAKRLFIKDGFRPDQLAVKPNFIADPAQDRQISANRSKTMVYVGRLVEEKGVDLLIEAWKMSNTDYTLEIIGDGQESDRLKQMAEGIESIKFLGWMAREELLARIEDCRYLVVASRWYEGLPMVVIEGLAMGTPVIVSDLGAMPELCDHGKAGAVYQGGSAKSLAAAITSASNEEDLWLTRSINARELYLRNFTPAVNYSVLMGIYESVIANHH